MLQLGKYIFLFFFCFNWYYFILIIYTILIIFRRRLRILNRAVVFLPCFAHQLNLCVDEIFKESTELKVSLDHAIRLATYFRNANNKYFIAKLREQQKITYDNYYTIASPGETRWNSYYEVCSSLLRTQKALQVNNLYIVN